MTESGPANIDTEFLSDLITRSAALLPAQGPITAFAFLNPLEALEEMPFTEGLRRGASLYGCEPYLPEERYRELMVKERIGLEDLDEVLGEDLRDSGDAQLLGLCSRFELRQAMLRYSFPTGDVDELTWVIEETEALERCRPEVRPEQKNRWLDMARRWVMRELQPGNAAEAGTAKANRPNGVGISHEQLVAALSDLPLYRIEDWSSDEWERATLKLLWTICVHGTRQVTDVTSRLEPFLRNKPLARDETSIDIDDLILQVLGPFCAAFIDQGLSTWQIPHREAGLLKCFREFYAVASPGEAAWLQGIHAILKDLQTRQLTPIQVVEESLQELGVPRDEWEDYVPATLLAFRGFAGMVWQMEVRPDRVPYPLKPGSIIEFVAVQLLLKRSILGWLLKHQLRWDIPLNQLRPKLRQRHQSRQLTSEQRAFKILQAAQLLGWDLAELARFGQRDWRTLVTEMASFSSMERRRLFHAAFELRYRRRALDAFAQHCRLRPASIANPKFQAVFCIDAREESFRRMLEEIDPRVETFGNAGFFNVPIYYRGAGDAHYAALCPIVVRPQHWITEEVALTMEEQAKRRSLIRKALGNVSNRFHLGTRELTGGAILTAGVGVLASIPLVGRVLFPRLSARLRKTADRFIDPPPVTRLRLERTEQKPGPEGGGIGLSLDEMVAMGERALRDPGLTSNFAPLIFIFGHGSWCLNNPHKSLYDCGACTGSAGGPNARALAMILNDQRVRDILASRGIAIPRETFVVGGLHNTGDDTLTFYDLDLMPSTHIEAFREARETLTRACEKNAHERCRRFDLAPLNITTRQAHLHVEERTEDLAQTRPEYGNCTNALCFVGRRSRVRGLYLDRRSFLMSYDYEQDDAEANILGRILGAVVPVCSGINMQYTLSAMDNRGFGSGTKLPHNITSLLGVMDGAASDLRSGLPWQGVDIHEPMRLMFIMETTPEAITKIMNRNPVVSRILRNGWAQLTLLDPFSPQLLLYQNGEFIPQRNAGEPLPEVDESIEWYRGWRDNLGFAVIRKGLIPDQPRFEAT